MPVAKKRKPEEKEEFLGFIADGMNVMDACAKTGKGHNWWYDWRNSDEQFADEWDIAAKKGSKRRLALLEAEADRRAREGYDVVTKMQTKSADGKDVGKAMIKSTKMYSDTLLIFRMKAEAQRAGDSSYEDKTNKKLSGTVGIKRVDEMDEDELVAFLGSEE